MDLGNGRGNCCFRSSAEHSGFSLQSIGAGGDVGSEALDDLAAFAFFAAVFAQSIYLEGMTGRGVVVLAAYLFF